jgi:hypothetical protein
MEYRGIEYQIIQTLSRSEWKWVVHLGEDQTKFGVAASKPKAIDCAIKIIDRAKEAQARARHRDGNSD